MKLTKKQIYIIGLIAVLIILSILYFGRSKSSVYSFVEVKKGNVVQEVSATGRVTPASDVDLAFEKSGKVVKVNAKIGDKVQEGEALVYLDSSELSAQLNSSEATLNSQIAKLDELKKGTRPEEIQIQEVTVENARVALDDAKKALINKLSDAFTKSDDAIRNQIDQFINNSKSQSPEISFVMTDSQLKSDIQWGRFALETTLNDWKKTVDGLSVNDDLDSLTTTTNNNLNEVKLLLDKSALAVNQLIASISLSQTTIDTYKTSIATARTNVNTAISNLSSAYEGYRTAKSTLTLQENELVLKKAGTITEQIKAQEALVEKAKADVSVYRVQIAKTVLRSPINGVVSKQDAKLGEIVAPNIVIVSVISSQQYKIEVNIPEADIAKVKVGNLANITLDAYGDNVIFNAHVVSIDPAETIVEGVATYKTTLQFDKKEESVKSGMTANIDIQTAQKEGVLYIPQRAITTKDNEKFVLIDTGKTEPEEKRIEVGIRGIDGYIEVVSGLNEGEKIINFSNNGN